jgi:hypothetical protein
MPGVPMRKQRSNKGKKRGPYKKRTVKLVANYKSNNNLQGEKKRKQRSNKGKKRVVYKKTNTPSNPVKLVEDYESEPEKRKRKQRSNKGKKRGPYKKRTTKFKIPDIVVNDYNENKNKSNREWGEVENVLFKDFMQNKKNNVKENKKRKHRINVVINNKNTKPLGKTRSGRSYR